MKGVEVFRCPKLAVFPINPTTRARIVYLPRSLQEQKGLLQGEDIQQEQDTHEPLKKIGGCGVQQPNITVDGMKLVAEFKTTKKKTDEQDQLPEPVERKQILSPERVFALYLFSI